MKKVIILAAMAAMALVSCQKNDAENTPVAESDAITFGTYSSRLSTKASPSNYEGDFGVFAFYTGQTAWSSYSAGEPNFMKNQKVTATVTSGTQTCTYDPVKYWPNNPSDKVSFFAYAPYDASKVWSSNTISYTVNSDVTTQIDLLWCAGQTDKTRTADKVNFAFKHALARIGFKVKYDLHSGDTDQIGGSSAKTTIAVQSVKLQSSTGSGVFFTGGTLNVTASDIASAWSGTGSQTFELGTSNFESVYSKVTSTATKLNKDDSYIKIIPQSTAFDVKIVYTVTTTDSALPGGKSEVTNTITTSVPSMAFAANNSYTLNLIIGMNAVNVSATVEDWTDVTPETDVNVPASL